MFRSRSHLTSFALWLALAGVVLRALVPVGFMPGWTGATAKAGDAGWLVICPTSPLHGALAAPEAPAAAPVHDHAAMLAAAAEAEAGDPHAHHHHGHPAAMAHAGMDHGAMAAAPVADPHAGHDAGRHGDHRIAAEHLSCPFAGAAAAALPVAGFGPVGLDAGASAPDRAAASAAVARIRHRLPPARAPPAASDDRAVG